MVAAASAAGCSLIDAAVGASEDPLTDNPGPGACNPDFSGCPGDECGSEFDLGAVPFNVDVNTCSFDIGPDFGLGACDPVAQPGFDMVFRFRVESGTSQPIRLCTSSGLTANMMLSSRCELAPIGECLPTDGNCVDVTANGSDNFVYWARRADGSDDACGGIHIEAELLQTGEVDCLDGSDNDFDGATDCEDDDCRGSQECASDIGPEGCDSIDNVNDPQFPPNIVDEAACNCVNDDGCDDINIGGGPVYVCHAGSGPSGESVCGPDCGPINWCGFIGAECVGGRCARPAGGPEQCLDGVDNDGDGDTDCEDSECQVDGGECQAGINPSELCDGVDQGGTPGIPNTTDDFACRCVNDSGCDGFLDSMGNPFRCHVGTELPSPGLCNPRCVVGGPDWCPQIAGVSCGADSTCQ